MKKTLSVILALLLATGMLAGCGGGQNPGASGAPGAIESQDSANGSQQTTAPVSANAGGTVSGSYKQYIDMKGKAYERISQAIDAHPELSMYALTLLPVTFMDIALMPLTIVDTPEAAVALEMLGMSGLKVEKAGNKYTITYTTKSEDKEQKVVQTCEYDAATDSMQSSITDENGKETMFFEYVKVGSGYASQYYTVSESENQIITAFFDETGLSAFGIQASDKAPASIFKNSGVTINLVKSADTYIVFDKDKVTVHDKGEDKTY